MKTEDLTAIGLTKEQIDKVHELNGKDVNAAKEAEHARMQVMVDGLNGQLADTRDALKKFDGVDPDALSTEIQNLNKKLQDQELEFKKQIADRDFSDKLTKSIAAAKGKDARAIMPFLDLDALKESKNQDADIAAAIDAVKAENDWLFESAEPFRNATAKTGGSGPDAPSGEQSARRAAARRAMGLPPEEKGE